MYHWSIVEQASEADLSILTEGVLNHGRGLAASGNTKQVACFVRNEQNIVAGGAGRTEFGRLFVGYLWVTLNLRSQGFGSKVLSKLEEEAGNRGCTDSLIETLSDNAADLYSRLGYRHIANIERYVGPFTRHVMLKPIISIGGESAG